MFPPERIASPPAVPAEIAVLAGALPGFAPYGVGGGVLLIYLRQP